MNARDRWIFAKSTKSGARKGAKTKCEVLLCNVDDLEAQRRLAKFRNSNPHLEAWLVHERPAFNAPKDAYHPEERREEA